MHTLYTIFKYFLVDKCLQKQPSELFYKIDVSLKKKISQNSQENTCAGVSFLMKFQASKTDTPTQVYYFCILRHF